MQMFLKLILILLLNSLLSRGVQIIFQGDSITECGRDLRKKYNPHSRLGACYPLIIASELSFHYPELNLTFLNFGLKMNWGVQDLQLNWPGTIKTDFDIVSILMGARQFKTDSIIDRNNFENTYVKLLEDVRAAKPNATIVICETFALPGDFTTYSINQFNQKGSWNDSLAQFRLIEKKLAIKYNAVFVSLQDAFEHAVINSDYSHWLSDGLHPTYSGHQLVANEWIKTVTGSNIAYQSRPILRHHRSRLGIGIEFDENTKEINQTGGFSIRKLFNQASAHSIKLRRDQSYVSHHNNVTSLQLHNSLPVAVFHQLFKQKHGKVRIVFSGDSITDGYKATRKVSYNDPTDNLADSFVYLIAAHLGKLYPTWNTVFSNKGHTGRRIKETTDSYSEEVLNEKPDVVNFLIGVNDVWMGHHLGVNYSYGEFINIYSRLITNTKQALPNTTIIICEPFAMKGDVPSTQNNWALFSATLTHIQTLIHKLAVQHSLIYVPLQAAFDAAATAHPPNDYWLFDGVHPTYAGRQLIANEWLRTLNFH